MGKGRLQFEDSTNKRELAPSLQMYLGTSIPQEGCFRSVSPVIAPISTRELGAENFWRSALCTMKLR
jgi:hypothetical protein